MLTTVRELLAHTEWANAVFFHAWGKSAVRDHEELRRRMEHIVLVQQAFLTVLKGEAPQFPPDGPPATFADLQVRAQASHAGLRALAASLDDAAAAETVRIPWFPDPPCVISRGDALIQSAMHTQHHRGQCITRLRDLGGEPKNVDWIIWLWKQKPEARWS